MGSRRSRLWAGDERCKAKEKLRSFDTDVLIAEDTFLDDIGDTVLAREALKEMHKKFVLLHILRLMKKFFNVITKPNESMKSYLRR
ncbi:hypothetical protein AVEN_125432-1 [Araneus ventricosus]|uniref:Uncharacterized protein n=1 Tax=Araneus ventricosus TaxID=182803 RepID=A0A4Y2R281_ARAVE|nr:hypothetical protein AVEN_125432-1 [Araneus ventricosus]